MLLITGWKRNIITVSVHSEEKRDDQRLEEGDLYYTEPAELISVSSDPAVCGDISECQKQYGLLSCRGDTGSILPYRFD